MTRKNALETIIPQNKIKAVNTSVIVSNSKCMSQHVNQTIRSGPHVMNTFHLTYSWHTL